MEKKCENCAAFVAKNSGVTIREAREASERSDLMGKLNGAENTINGMKMEIEGLRAVRRDAETETALIRQSMAPLIEFLNNSEYKQPIFQAGELAVQVIKRLENERDTVQEHLALSDTVKRCTTDDIKRLTEFLNESDHEMRPQWSACYIASKVIKQLETDKAELEEGNKYLRDAIADIGTEIPWLEQRIECIRRELWPAVSLKMDVKIPKAQAERISKLLNGSKS